MKYLRRCNLHDVFTLGMIVGMFLALIQNALAGQSASSMTEHSDFLLVVIASLLAYVSWTIRRFIKTSEAHRHMTVVHTKLLLMLVREHNKNHCSDIQIEELMCDENKE